MPEEMLSRKRKHEDGETEGSDMEGEDDRKAPVTDERVLAALMELTSHSSRFHVETTKTKMREREREMMLFIGT